MNNLFLTVLNMSLTGAFVVVAICLARLPLKKAPKIIFYCLWAVAGIRLLFPLSAYSVFSLVPFGTHSISNAVSQSFVLLPPSIDGGVSIFDISSYAQPAEVGVAAINNPLLFWLGIGAYLWIIGVAVMLIYGIVTYAIFKTKMNEAVHIHGNIYEAKNIKSPFVLGFFAPKIYLPFDLNGEKYNCVILHEQIHVERYDHVVKFVAYYILCVHWFNPLVWLAFKLMSRDMEMSCDEAVLRKMGIDETKNEYSMSLVALATEGRFVHGSPLAFGESSIKERVKNVLNFKKRSKSITIVSAVLVLILEFGLLTSQAGANTGVPLIGNGFVFEIPHIEAGEVVLIGQLNLRPGVQYRYTFSAEGGQGVFIALHRSPDIERDEGVTWFQLFGGGTITSSDGFGGLGFTGIVPQTVYVYIGSRGSGNTDLTNVTGRIERNGFNLFNEIREIFRDDEIDNTPHETADEFSLETGNELNESNACLYQLKNVANVNESL